MTYGEYRRTYPRLNILRGFAGNEPQSLTTIAKPKSDAAIKSGMLIVQDDDGLWVKCDSATHAGKIPHFAVQDQTDTDVLSSGVLLGLSCLGDFEIQTSYFDSTDNWGTGDAAVKGTAALVGSVDKGDHLAASEVVAVVTRGGVVNINAINSEADPDVNGQVNVLNLVTRWKPAAA